MALLYQAQGNITRAVEYLDQRLKKNEGRSKALRQIQLDMLKSKDYQHPFY